MASPRQVQFGTDDLESRLSSTSPKPNPSRVSVEGHSIRSEPSSDPKGPGMLRRANRSKTGATFRTVDAVKFKPNWHAGQEPGLDPSKPNGGRTTTPMRHEECQITVVDYSETDINIHELDNASLIKFLEKPQEDWVKCRWINVNGISWDVVQALAQNKHLHTLAVEDVITANNRTKADWYSEHTYIIMRLQKLVHREMFDLENKESDSEDATIGSGNSGGFLKSLWGWGHDTPEETEDDFIKRHTELVPPKSQRKLRTIQSYVGGHNHERAAYLEKHSALTKKNLAVSAEQVSMFLTNDNTVIAFFEHSADDLETPILRRLNSPDTILRESCDASMLLQALIDGIIDLALPIATSYQEIIGELELNVLTEPSITHTTNLYILTSEMTKIRNFVSPALNLISALREHKEPAIRGAHGDMKKGSGVTISPLAQTYFGDVEDHIILITDSLDSMRHACDNMIDLIFNTIAAFQNESMKQLTVVTIIFLPLSFMTGYFGMNIVDFPSIHHNESYFWIVAVPVGVAVALFLMKDIIKWYFTRVIQRRLISKNRKGRLLKEKNR